MPTKNIVRFLLAAFALLITDYGLLVTPAQAASARPNVVFILADDLGWADVAFHGGNAPTPNLDQLAARGVELTQHYVAPVCSPTRTGLMTGRCWSRFDVTTPTTRVASRLVIPVSRTWVCTYTVAGAVACADAPTYQP